MTDLTTLTPAEIDALWATAKEPLDRAYAIKWESEKKMRRYEKAGYKIPEYLTDGVAPLDAKIAEIRLTLAPFEAEWDRRGGWTRAYIVPGGHIHKATWCHTLYPTTIIGWLPEQSGWTEEEIVAAAGIMACTVCYPTAPVEALRAAEAARKAEGRCPGSGTYDHDSSGLRYAAPRAKCNHCRHVISATSTGKLRAHKPDGTRG